MNTQNSKAFALQLWGSWPKVWLAGVTPIILLDLAKAAIAAGVAKSQNLISVKE